MFFLKRFLLAFCPRKGYGQLMNAGIGGALGAMVIMTLIGGYVFGLVASKRVDVAMQMTSGYAKNLPPFKVEQGRLVVPNIPQPYVYNDKEGQTVIVIDTTNRTTIEMVTASYPKIYKVLLTSDHIYALPPGGKPTVIPMAQLNGVNNSNIVEVFKKDVVKVLPVIVWMSIVLSIFGRIIIASILAGIMTAIAVGGSQRTFKQTGGIVLHAMIPATLLQILTNAVTHARLSQGNMDLSGLFFQAVGFAVVVLVMSLTALYKAEPEYLIS